MLVRCAVSLMVMFVRSGMKELHADKHTTASEELHKNVFRNGH